jgi:hypothetical protein
MPSPAARAKTAAGRAGDIEVRASDGPTGDWSSLSNGELIEFALRFAWTGGRRWSHDAAGRDAMVRIPGPRCHGRGVVVPELCAGV